MLSGECLLLVDGEERPLKAWDFVHCPAETEHSWSARAKARAWSSWSARAGWPTKGIVYPPRARPRHGAGVEMETDVPAEAYAPFPKWQPGPPANCDGPLPWDAPLA